MIDRVRLKELVGAIVAEVEPDDVFIIEDNFDGLVDDWHLAVAQDEGRFIGGVEVAVFAAAVVPFLLNFLGDVVKDVVKDQLKKAAGVALDKLLRRQASGDEAIKLRADIELAIAESRVSKQQKEVLNIGFGVLFAKLQPASE